MILKPGNRLLCIRDEVYGHLEDGTNLHKENPIPNKHCVYYIRAIRERSDLFKWINTIDEKDISKYEFDVGEKELGTFSPNSGDYETLGFWYSGKRFVVYYEEYNKEYKSTLEIKGDVIKI